MFAFENDVQDFAPISYSVSKLTEKIVDFFHQQNKNNIQVKYIGNYRWKIENRRETQQQRRPKNFHRQIERLRLQFQR